MANRELSFTLADDIYIRYLSFNGAEDLEAEMIKRFKPPSQPPPFSFSLQCVGVLTRLTLVQCTTLDQVIIRNWPTFHLRFDPSFEACAVNISNWMCHLQTLTPHTLICRKENLSLTLTWLTTMMSETAAVVPRFVQNAGGKFLLLVLLGVGGVLSWARTAGTWWLRWRYWTLVWGRTLGLSIFSGCTVGGGGCIAGLVHNHLHQLELSHYGRCFVS